MVQLRYYWNVTPFKVAPENPAMATCGSAVIKTSIRQLVPKEPSPRRKVEDEHVPDQRPYTSAATASEIAPVVVVFFTIPVPREAQLWLLVPSVNVAVFATPVPPLPATKVALNPAAVPDVD